MLEPITKKWEDDSDLDRFRFSFFCDRCAEKIATLDYRSECGLKPKIIMKESERRARELIWQKDHEFAYERANNEAALQFNRCPKCGRRVCQDCFSVFDDLCADCANAKQTVPMQK